MDFHDYYQILGVPPTASIKEISSAYRKLAQQHHPDLQPADKRHQAELDMKMLNEAYDVLQDSSRREDYDRKYARVINRKVFSSHTRSSVTSKSHSLGKLTSLGIDILSVAFLIIGGYFIFIVWTPIFAELTNAFRYPNEFLLLVIWWLCIGRVVFRLLPFKRPK